MSQTATEKMRAHVAQLATQHRITVTFHADWSADQAMASIPRREVECRPITTTRDYATALHEMGHIAIIDAGLFPGDTPSVNVLIAAHVATTDDLRAAVANETAAWAWAIEHAILWDGEMEAERRTSLATYEQGLKDAPSLSHPQALLAMTVNPYLPARTWARKRMLATVDQIATPDQRPKAVAYLTRVWADADQVLD